MPGSISNIDLIGRTQRAPFFERIASFCRLILFDKRGTGASDQVAGSPISRHGWTTSARSWTRSARSVLRVVGVSEGGPMSILFAATYPERTAALVVYGSMPRFVWAPDFPLGQPLDEYLREAEEWSREWGT